MIEVLEKLSLSSNETVSIDYKIEKASETFCSNTDNNNQTLELHPTLEGSLGLAKHCRGFEWPHVVPLMTLTGTVDGKLCKKLFLLDSGASMNFISGEFVAQHSLRTRELKQAFKIRLADGTPLSCTSVIDTARIDLSGENAYAGTHQLMVLHGLCGHDVVLGRPFLRRAGAVVDHEKDHIEWRSPKNRSDRKDWRKSHQVSPPPLSSHEEVSSSTTTSDISSTATSPLEPSLVEATVESSLVEEKLTSITPLNDQPDPKDVSSTHEVGSPKQRRRLDGVLSNYKARLAPKMGKLPPHRKGYDHTITKKNNDSKPVKLPAIRQRPALARAMKAKLDELSAEGKIRRSTSAYGAPAFMIEQGGKQRMVTNFVKLNEQTVTNATSLPHIDELIARLGKAKVFSKLDLTSGFHQVRMREEDIEKTGFTTPFGHYEWVVMPFGEKNAPATFVQLLNQLVLVDLVHDFIIVFVDDILVFSEDEDQHIEHVKAVLDRLADHELFINPDKCTWMVDEVDFLGYHLRAGEGAVELMIQENKVRAVTDWPVPKTISQLRSFLGTANFSRPFVKDFSTIAAPMTSATAGKFKSKNAAVTWGEKEQASFEAMKRALTSAPALAVPDETKPFVLYTDASDFGIGATLCQFNDKNKAMQICGYMSAKLKGAELNWPTHEKEMFALVRALEHWSMHFVQVLHPITVYTDNIAMLYMLKSEDHHNIHGRQARWTNVLTRFNLDPQRIEGSKNIQADALSRRADLDGGREELQAMRRAQAELALRHLGWSSKTASIDDSTATLASIDDSTATRAVVMESETSDVSASSSHLIDDIKNAYAADDRCVRMMNDPKRYHVTVNKGLIFNEHNRILVPAVPKLRSAILVECHDVLTSGHLGISKTVARVRKNFDWTGVVADAHDFVKSCTKCQMNKARNLKEAGLLQPIAPPMTKGLVISIDFVGELPRTARGKDYIMVITDRFSKRVWYAATRKTITAKQAAKIIFDQVVRHQGLPDVIISDRDVRFKAKLWRELWRECGTKLSMTVSFRAQANGGTETHNRVMQDMLRSFVSESRSDWDLKLAALEIAYNASLNEITGCTPFELDIGMQPRLPIDLALQEAGRKPLSLDHFISNWENSWSTAHKNIRDAQARQKISADQTRRDEQYKVGDMAWIRRDRGTLQGSMSAIQKLGPRVQGPYKITELHGDHNMTLKLKENDRRHSRFHVSQLRPFVRRDEARFPQVDEKDEEQGDDHLGTEDESTDELTSSIDQSTRAAVPISKRSPRQRKQVDHGVYVKH